MILNMNKIINNYSYILTSTKIWNLKKKKKKKDKQKQKNKNKNKADQLNNRVGD